MTRLPSGYRKPVAYHTAAWLLGGVFTGATVSYLAYTAKKLGSSPPLVAALIASPLLASLLAPLYVDWRRQVSSAAMASYPRVASGAVLMLIVFCGSRASFLPLAMLGWFLYQSSNPFYGGRWSP